MQTKHIEGSREDSASKGNRNGLGDVIAHDSDHVIVKGGGLCQIIGAVPGRVTEEDGIPALSINKG